MKVSDKIYFDLKTETVPGQVLDVLEYKNPDYYQKMNLGLSVWGIPKVVHTYELEQDGKVLTVTRGEALKIKPYFGGNWKPVFEHTDRPVTLQYINNDFPLDEHQEAAVAALKNKRQGIVHAVTSAGKSLIILKAAVEIGQRTLIVVHRKVLMQQFKEDIEKYIRDEHGNKIIPGIIGDGSLTVGDITIAIDKTLAKNLGALKEEFGTVFLDECHLAPAATLFELLNGINSRNRFGVSGTLKRKDGKEFLIYSTFGEVIATITKEELLEKGRVVPVHVKLLESETRFDWDSAVEGTGSTTKARALQEETLRDDPNRNSLILDQLEKLPGKTIVLSRYVKPCFDLQIAYETRTGLKAGVITGKNAKTALEAYEGMKHGDLKVIFATVGCVSTGVSISDLDNLMLISPIFSNELLLHQIRGRLMRTAEGKQFGVLWLVWDPYIFDDWKLKRFLSIMKN